MTEIINIRACDDPRDAIHWAIELLARGEWVGLPGDASYVVATQSLRAESVRRLRAEMGSQLALAVRSADELLDFCPGLGWRGERLCRCLWPGPVILEVPTQEDGPGLSQAFAEAVRQAISWEEGIRAWMPRQVDFCSLQKLLASPLVTGEVSREPTIGGAKELADHFAGKLRLVLDAGRIQNGGQSSVVRIEAETGTWRIMREGTIDEATIREQTPVSLVFVCTGNTCRSPLAAAILRKMLAERLECESHELVERGFLVTSAGIAADYGMPAAAESLVLAEEHGLDLASHRSQCLTDTLLDRADCIFAMTGSHRSAILAQRPDLADRVELLSRDGMDIVDPIGGGPAEYERARTEIERELSVIVEQMPLDRNSS